MPIWRKWGEEMSVFLRKLRYRFHAPQRKHRKKQRHLPVGKEIIFCFFLILILIGCIPGFYHTETRVGALAQKAAVSELNGRITKTVNRAVESVLEQEKIDSRKLISVEKDELGRIQSLSADYLVINRMKSALAILVQEELDSLNVIEAHIPVGMLFSDTLFTGAGFTVPVKIFVSNAIEVEFYDEFVSAGINQTKYKLAAEVRVPAQAAGLFHREETLVVTQVPVAETVVVGEVPKTYLGLAEKR